MVDPPADPFGRNRAGRQLRARVRLETDEHATEWTRAWSSRDGRWNWLLAARHRDFVVLTDQRLLLYSCGFFTRRPRRCVFAETFRSLEADDIGTSPAQHVRLSGWRGRPLRLDFGHDATSRAVASALIERAAAPAATPDGPAPPARNDDPEDPCPS